ncbi:hypothetical protein FPE01S_01_01280 [Flavihumibacter petaseus NBRC 106054]|uniref:DUF4239 domain-containing protein n=2 Tax=Flavihumibacter TaxID=1004301 RepID=A0A0E9MUM0_9BACT|nr:hypothetical protein FPE01S_01_01280 [Flavihumibacter petaseus NBRC 106054]
MANRMHLHEHMEWTSNNLSGAVISFFSLLLAFSLSSSAGSNKERTRLIHQHADAIGRLYRKSFLLNDSVKASIKSYAVQCLNLKIRSSQLHGDARRHIDSASFWLNENYLKSITRIKNANAEDQQVARLIADEVQAIMALDNNIHYSNQERTPAMVMLLLMVGSLMVGFLMGLGRYHFRQRKYLGPTLFLFLSTMTVLAIQDMDNPHTGMIRPPYDVYQDALNEINND